MTEINDDIKAGTEKVYLVKQQDAGDQSTIELMFEEARLEKKYLVFKGNYACVTHVTLYLSGCISAILMQFVFHCRYSKTT